MKTNGILLAGIAVAAMITSSAQAGTYFVNRSFSLGGDSVTLTGTLDVALGNYTIVNAGASPFTSVNLTLAVNSVSYNLDNAVTSLISGTGTFFINATPTTLTFSTANANGGSPADLVFSETSAVGPNYYAIGYDGSPGFETAVTSGPDVAVSLVLPVVFGVAVPEPSTFALLVLGAAFIVRRRHA